MEYVSMATSLQKGGFALFLTAAASLSTIAPAHAAIVTVNDSGSWINGTDTLANLGLNLVEIPNGAEAFGVYLPKISSPLGDIEFSPSVVKRPIGSDQSTNWVTWSNGYQGEVYAAYNTTTLNLKLPNLTAFDFYAEPNQYNLFTISAIAQSGVVSDVLAQTINGKAGAQYFGFYSDDPLDPIQSIQISAPAEANGFAIGQLRGAKAASATVPSPALLPGMIVMGLGMWRKHRSKSNLG
jgi:hypothetical protein